MTILTDITLFFCSICDELLNNKEFEFNLAAKIIIIKITING